MDDFMKKVSVIDIGTNSTRVLFADIENNNIINRKKEIITTRLGEKIDSDQRLTDRAINDTYDAIKAFQRQAQQAGYQVLKLIATSAVRDAINQHVLIDKIKNQLELTIEIISGDQEAEYGFYGIANAFHPTEDVLVIDIGGGSTELIRGSHSIKQMKSLNVGAVRMTEKCITSDPINTKDFECLQHSIHEVLNDYLTSINNNNIQKIIGIGGTITTLCAINKALEEYNPDAVHKSKITIEDLNRMIQQFQQTTLEERKQIIGLSPKRADIILAGSIILKTIMNHLRFNELYISDYDNLEGIIFKDFLK